MAEPGLPAPRRRPPIPRGPYLVAGLGTAGQAAVRALAGLAGVAAVAVHDPLPLSSVERVASDLRARGHEVTVGGDGRDVLARFRPGCVVKSPGIPFSAPLLARAREVGAEVIDEAELGWRLDSRPVVAVTGTNGKSTTAALACAAAEAAGARPVVAGNTVLGPPLSGLASEDGDVVVAEVSSFQLEGCPALLPEVAVLTNLTEDHLDRHGTMEAYRACKRRLFLRDGSCAPAAVVNVDDPMGQELAPTIREAGGRVATYGRDQADYRIASSEWGIDGGTVILDTPRGELQMETALPGEHNAMNLAAGAALAGVLGVEPWTAGRALERVPRVPGRFEVIASSPVAVIVDYAHNPDGVRRILGTLRRLADRSPGSRLHVVIGGVNYMADDQLRHMGRAAARGADHLVLTTERWRPDDVTEPMAALVAGAREEGGASVEEVGDRRAAIGRALASCVSGDIVAVLGRGAVDAPLFDASGSHAPFDDRVEARRALEGA